MIEAARLLTLKAAHMMDTVGNKVARAEIAMIKVYVPNVAQQVMDWAIQAHGGGGVSDDFPVAWMYAWNRVLRLVDGPDEVHRNAIAKLELAKHIRCRRKLTRRLRIRLRSRNRLGCTASITEARQRRWLVVQIGREHVRRTAAR